MDEKTLKFIANNFSSKKLSKGIIRTKISGNKYAILRCDTRYNSKKCFLVKDVVLSAEIKHKQANSTDSIKKYVSCYNCGIFIEEECFDNRDYILCKYCFECMQNALIIKKENITFVYINETENACSPYMSPFIYIIKNKIIKHVAIEIIRTNPLYKKTKPNLDMYDYCHKEKIKLPKNSHLNKTKNFELYRYKERNTKNYITMCKKCLEFREYASFMTNYNFVYIKEIFSNNNLLPELKNLIAKYMLRVVAY